MMSRAFRVWRAENCGRRAGESGPTTTTTTSKRQGKIQKQEEE
jgi:hypothetical protein